MCQPASMIVTKKDVLWSKNTDSHEDIIDELSFHMDGVRGPNGVRVEIFPKDGDLSSNTRTWAFKVDQDILPEWWDRDDAEKRTRVALKAWKAAKVITKDVAVLREGQFYIYGGTIQAVEGGTIQSVEGGTIAEISGAATVIMYTAYDASTLKSQTAVILDRTKAGKVTMVTG